MRLRPLPPSMSTLVSRKPSTMGWRTSAAGAWQVRGLGSSFSSKVIGVVAHGCAAVTWYIWLSSRRAFFLLLFEVNVSYTIRTLWSRGEASYYLTGDVRPKIGSPYLATCLTTQQARSLWVGFASSKTECIGHGLSSNSSSTDLGLVFLSSGSRSGDRCVYARLTRDFSCRAAGGVPMFICYALHVFSMAQYLRTMSDSSVKL